MGMEHFDGNSKDPLLLKPPRLWEAVHLISNTLQKNRFLSDIVVFLCGEPGPRLSRDTVSPKSRRGSTTLFQEIRGWSARGTESIRPLREGIDRALIQI